MNEIEVKRVTAVLAWASWYYKIPRLISDQYNNSLQCVGVVSSSEIKFTVGSTSVSVDRTSHFGRLSDPKGHVVYAHVSDGARLQCNLDEDGHIRTVTVLSGGPSGEIVAVTGYDKVSTQYFGSSTEFLMHS